MDHDICNFSWDMRGCCPGYEYAAASNSSSLSRAVPVAGHGSRASWRVGIAGTSSSIHPLRFLQARFATWALITSPTLLHPITSPSILSPSIERPMKIEIIVDPSRPVALSQRVAPAPAAAATTPATAPAAKANGASRLVGSMCGGAS